MLDLRLTETKPQTPSFVNGPSLRLGNSQPLNNLHKPRITVGSPPKRPEVFSIGGSSHHNTALVISVLAILITASAGWFIGYRQGLVQSQITTIDQNIAKLNERFTSADLAAPLKKIEQTSKQASLLNKSRTSLTDWSKILTDFTAKLPSGVRLDEMSFTDKGMVLLRGVGSNYKDIATLTSALNSGVIFSNVTLKSASLREAASGTEIIFSLEGKYQSVKVETTKTDTKSPQ